jgi:hypothetical protein
MLDPMIVPAAIFALLFITLATPTDTSGAEVPKATKVRPITNSDTPSWIAILELASINLSAPHTKRTKPTIRRVAVVMKSIAAF